MRGRLTVIVPLLSLLWLAPGPLAAQTQARVDLGSDLTTPGDVARIPITLTKDEQSAGVETEITFPAALSFVDAELGEAGQAVSAEIKTQPAAGKVVVRIQAPQGKVLPTGIVGLARFKVDEKVDTSGSTELKLDHQPSVIDRDGRKQRAEGSAGSVTVLTKPPQAIVCFFYMH
jgi:hypothetical protein